MPKISKRNGTTLIGGLFALAGCMVGPDYEAPEVTVSDEFRSRLEQRVSGEIVAASEAQIPESTGPNFALLTWEQVFVDPLLSSLIATALQNNLELVAVRARVESAEAILAQTRSSLLPQLSVPFVFEDRAENAIGGRNAGDFRYQLSGALAWEVDFFGFNRRRVEFARANVLAARHRLHLTHISLIRRLATAYFELLDVSARAAITEQTIETRLRALQILRLRRESGIISGLAVRQAEVALAEAEAALPGFLRLRLDLENAIRVLTGNIPDSLGRISQLAGEVSLFIDVPESLPTGLPSQLLRRRPDILIAEANLKAATAMIGVAQADFFPRLALTGERGLRSDDLDSFLRSGVDAWRVSTTLTQPVYQGGRLRGALREAEAARDEALARYQQVILVALSEVSAALQGYGQAESLVEINKRRRDSARSYLDLATLKYEEGVLGYLDVLDGQRQLFEADLSLSAARRDRLVALAALYGALGGGWHESSDEF